MGTRQATVVYSRRSIHPAEAAVIRWIGELPERPTVGDVLKLVETRARELLSYAAKRSYVDRLIGRTDAEYHDYRRSNKNQYGGHAIPKKPIKTKCQCKRVCGGACRNRLNYRECNDTICRASVCGNHKMTIALVTGQIPRVIRKPSPGRGDGAFADEYIKKGAFVREYTWRIIDNEQRVKLVQRGRADYVMELSKNLYIDAMPVGNEARLINHSCKPNCEYRLVYIDTVPRVGVFAIRDVTVNEELTVNYGTD